MSAIAEFVDYVTQASNWTGPKGLLRLTVNQLVVSGIAVGVASAIALPAGLGFGHVRRGGLAAMSVANIGRALPSFAVLVLAFGVFSQQGRGLSIWPTAVALTLLAIPPIFTNTFTGVRGVDPRTRDAAAGMGMRPWQQLWKVEAPIALPLVMTGLRVSATQVVATATLGAWVGYQCLGTLIFEGFAQQNDGKILTGAVMVSVLTITIEVVMARLERRLSPWAEVRRDGPVDEPPEPTLVADTHPS
jgi:osmoprotectant transport system permease protein